MPAFSAMKKKQPITSEEVIASTSNYKAAANWMLGPVRSWLNDKNVSISEFPVLPATIAALIALIDDGKLNFSIASTRVLPALVAEPAPQPDGYCRQSQPGAGFRRKQCSRLGGRSITENAGKSSGIQERKKGLMGLFVGEVKKVSKGKADPRLTNDILLKKLQEN